ncbi:MULTISPECIES: hypothetical protein [Paenibacillus]|uniref:hypothetical protein n=1 Tax=Paenibacillus TaxID=44249 RepID=UPI0022B85A44|nr:hypothetical protein [Paenibacillus caseinilyticus]MCZ8518528.1 hypothetical protein [Paenibacillus caseinilyticus]
MNSITFAQGYRYILVKLTSAGFALLCLLGLAALVNFFDPYRIFGALEELGLWRILYFYGIGCSVLIDLLVRYIPWARRGSGRLLELLLYLVCGYLYFPALAYIRSGADLSSWVLSTNLLIAGPVGAFGALAFRAGSKAAAKHAAVPYLAGIILPCILFVLMIAVNNQKIGWRETRTASSYEASFSSFNGSQAIPVEVRKGQTLVFSILWDTQGGSSVGHHVLKPSGSYADFEETADHRSAVQIEEDGTYRIIADSRGGSRGRFKVTWDIRE